MAFLPGQIGGGSGQLTPEQVERLRLAAQEAASRGVDTSPVAHWAAALARGIDAYGGYRGNIRANEQEESGLASADEYIQNDPVLASLLGGDVQPPQGVQSFQEVVPGSVPQAIAGQHQVATQPGPEELTADPGIANYFSAIRQAESGGNDAAKNPLSSATGRYQFIQSTWDGLRNQYPELGLTADGRTDPDQQERAIRKFTADNAEYLRKSGIHAGSAELYAAHFLGPAGAVKLLSLPDSTPVSQGVGEGVIKANPFLANQTVGDFKQWAASKAGGSAPASSGGFAPAPTMGPNVNVGALAQAQANPWVAKKYGPAIDALMKQGMSRDDAVYEQQLKQQDPMYQAQLQQQQLQNEALMNPPAPDPVFQGGQWWDISSGQPQPLTQAQAEQTAAQQNYEFLISQGMDPQTAMDRAFSGGTTVNVGGEGMPGLGKLSADYGYVMDPATGQPVIDPSTGLPQAAPVPGSPAAQQIEQAAQMAEGQQELANRSGSVVLQDIDRALEQSNTFGTTGLIGGQLSGIGGTPARDLDATLSTIRSNIGFDRLQQMREASPTGGALGAVSERELSELQAVLGNLSQNQSREQLQRNLNRLKEMYSEIVRKAEAYPNAAQFGFGSGVQESGTPQPGQVEDGYRFIGGNPSDPNSWERVQ